MTDRRKLTFEQAEGFEPLPQQLALKQISGGLRAGLFYILHDHLLRDVDPYDGQLAHPWFTLLRRHWVVRRHGMADEFSERVRPNVQDLKGLILTGNYAVVLGLFEWLIRQPECPYDFREDLNRILEGNRAAYRVIDNTMMPIGSEEEAQVVTKAIAAVSTQEFSGARQHLRSAAGHLTSGKWSDAVRESINAVESVVRAITGESTFGAALKVVERRWRIHPTLKDGFNKLYGYTNGEQGIRHSLIDEGAAAVDEQEAMFMFGACASVITYLVGKHQKAGK